MEWIGLTIFTLVVAIPWFWGIGDLYTGWRFKRDAGTNIDQTAFWLNWFAFKWSWTNYSHVIAEKLPFFKKDLTETFGVRPDDGRIT